MIRLKVKEVAEARGMSQRQLSKLTGIDMKNIQRIFRNPAHNIKIETLDRIAIALDIDASALIESVKTK